MLFGSDKVPEMARTMGKAMAQLKNATNDIKNEISKGASDNGFDPKMLSDLTNNITSEINSAKANLLGDTNSLKGISDSISSEISKAKEGLLGETSTSLADDSTKTITENDKLSEDAKLQNDKLNEEIEDSIGPIKRKK
jgi:sec-independent protein translocase protein TatA